VCVNKEFTMPDPLSVRLLRAALPPRTPRLPPQRLLVLRPDERLGNAVLSSGLLAELRRHFPLAQIDWLVPVRYAPLFADNPYAISILAFDKRSLFTHPLRWAAFIRKLRKRAYDVAIDASHAHAPSRTAMLLALTSGAPVRIGHTHPSRPAGYTHLVDSDPHEHDFWRKRRLAAALGGASADADIRPWVGKTPPEIERQAIAWLKSVGDRAPLLLWPGSRKPDRRLDPTLWKTLAQTLAAQGPLVIGWGPGEEAQAQALADASASLLLPPADPLLLAALCRGCAAYVGHDTGPLHLAIACGLPSACLYPPGSDAADWAWPGPEHRSLALAPDTIDAQLPLLLDWAARSRNGGEP
jgi:ADP-heptose:LPS heptosyltransferase